LQDALFRHAGFLRALGIELPVLLVPAGVLGDAADKFLFLDPLLLLLFLAAGLLRALGFRLGRLFFLGEPALALAFFFLLGLFP
jgi:hypothetical protein